MTTRGRALDRRHGGCVRGAAFRLSARITSGNEGVRQPLALRYRNFALEMGARIGAPDGLACDGFDACCEHLIIADDDNGQVVGAYWILPPEARAKVPPLLHGYLSLGAQIAAPPARDREFNAADLLVQPPVSRLHARYACRFLGRSVNG